MVFPLLCWQSSDVTRLLLHLSSWWPRAAVPFEYVCQLSVLWELLYIHAVVDWWQWGPSLLFSFSGPVWFLMYLSAQLGQIASSIIGTRYENVDSCAVAQTRCYDCNLEASWGRLTSKLKMGEGEHECVSGSEGEEQGEKQVINF